MPKRKCTHIPLQLLKAPKKHPAFQINLNLPRIANSHKGSHDSTLELPGETIASIY